MIEQVKSIVLTVLILTSLVLSGLLWYRSPNVEEINRTDYIPQQLIGESYQLEELVKPRSIVYHPGDGSHLMSFSGDDVYDLITESLPEWQLVSIEEKTMTTAEWERMLSELPGWELRFPVPIPASLFSERLIPGLNQLEEDLRIDRLWVYRQQDDLSVLLISDIDNKIYESDMVSPKEGNVFAQKQELGLLNVLPVVERIVSANPYEPVSVRINYFPEKELTMPEWKASLQETDVEQMKILLFLDPSLVRTVTDAEEGTVVMQDGSRTVRYVEANNMLYYQNYKMKLDAKPISSDLHEAVQFINHHGGWMADHRLVQIEGTQSEDKPNRYGFRLVKDGLPVYDEGDQNRYGTLMAVESKGGHVLRYERSLHFTEEDEYSQSTPVTGGPQALEHLKAEFDMADVRDMYPAYRIQKKDDDLTYLPGWRIEFRNGDETWFEVPADEDEGGEANGLE